MLRAFLTAPNRPAPHSTQEDRTDVGSGIAGGSWLNSAERYRKEQQMEEINQGRGEPLDRNDSQYEEMNNPSNPQE